MPRPLSLNISLGNNSVTRCTIILLRHWFSAFAVQPPNQTISCLFIHSFFIICVSTVLLAMKCNIHFKCLFFVDLDDSLFTTAAGERRKIIIRRANVLTGKQSAFAARDQNWVCLLTLPRPYIRVLSCYQLPRTYIHTPKQRTLLRAPLFGIAWINYALLLEKIIVTSGWRGFFALSKKEKTPIQSKCRIFLLKSLQMAEDRRPTLNVCRHVFRNLCFVWLAEN